LGPGTSDTFSDWQRHSGQHFSLARSPHWDGADAERWHVAQGHRLVDELIKAPPAMRPTLDIWAFDADSEENDIAGVAPQSAGLWVHEPAEQS
jgi:hypothetical protein